MTDQIDPALTGEEGPPYLGSEPPPWAARGLASILLALFFCVAVASILIHVPETVSAAFVLVPTRPTDPVRAFRDGILTEVLTGDARKLRTGEAMFRIESPPVGDRATEWGGLKAQLAGADARLENLRARYASERRARGDESAQQKARLESLDRTIQMNTEQLAIAGELAQRQKKTLEEGVSSWVDSARLRIEINRLEVEAEQAKADRENTRRAIGKLEHEMRGKESEFQEQERSLGEEVAKARIRSGMLEKELAQTGSQLTVKAPCDGSVLKMHVSNAGTAVREGDLLAEVACEGRVLQAELEIPADGIALVRAGQRVKLLYDAFPYQRYGVRSAIVAWVSPASIAGKEGASGFRALADLTESSVLVRGERRSVAPGMGGHARVIVGRRSLVSYAFEPLRQLKESLAGEPSK
jgi:membrane fusion protein